MLNFLVIYICNNAGAYTTSHIIKHYQYRLHPYHPLIHVFFLVPLLVVLILLRVVPSGLFYAKSSDVLLVQIGMVVLHNTRIDKSVPKVLATTTYLFFINIYFIFFHLLINNICPLDIDSQKSFSICRIAHRKKIVSMIINKGLLKKGFNNLLFLYSLFLILLHIL